MLHTQLLSELPTSKRLATTMHALHSGRAFGAAGTALVVITGLTLAALAVTGLVVWWKKTLRRTKRLDSSAAVTANTAS